MSVDYDEDLYEGPEDFIQENGEYVHEQEFDGGSIVTVYEYAGKFYAFNDAGMDEYSTLEEADRQNGLDDPEVGWREMEKKQKLIDEMLGG